MEESKKEVEPQKEEQQNNNEQTNNNANNETAFIELKKYIDVRIDEIINRFNKADNPEEKVDKKIEENKEW